MRGGIDVARGAGQVVQVPPTPAPRDERAGAPIGYTAAPCPVPYALSHVALVAFIVLGRLGYQDLHFDDDDGVLRGHDGDTAIALRVWAEDEARSCVEVTSELHPESVLGRGANLRRAERLGEDIAEAAATIARAGGPGPASWEPAPDPAASWEPAPDPAASWEPAPAPAPVPRERVREPAVVVSALAAVVSAPAAVAPVPVQPVGPPPGWYHDPWNRATLRWFDGSAWTENTREPQQV